MTGAGPLGLPGTNIRTRSSTATAAAILGALAAGVIFALLALGIQACGRVQDQAGTATATATVVQTIAAVTNKTTRTGNGGATTVSTLPAGAVDIHGIDWKSIVDAKPLVRDVEEVIYADFTGDGREEALVLVRLEGSGAYLDYYVFTVNGDAVIDLYEKLGVSHGRVALGILPGSFVETTAAYAPGDPNCCPSNLMLTTYQWSASAGVFTAVIVEMAPNTQ